MHCLLLAIVCQTAVIIFMRLSNVFFKKCICLCSNYFYLMGYIFSTLILRCLPAGIANLLLEGASELFVATIGAEFFKEIFSPLQLILM